MQIAIDGPAGAGKSTVAKDIASDLHIHYLDTGAMYRALACSLEDGGVDTTDEDAVAALLPEMRMEVLFDGDDQHVVINGRDMTSEIRTERAALGASNVAVFRAVREKLVALQRQIAAQNDVVMDGRDIGTWVLPDADFKFFLTASVEARTRRRCQDLQKAGMPFDEQEIRREIELRDEQDMSREVAPLRQADDAMVIDTTDITQKQAADRILSIIRGTVSP